MHTFAFGILDNKKGGAILDRSTGVHELGLGIDIASGLLAQSVQTDLLVKQSAFEESGVSKVRILHISRKSMM